MRPMDQYNRRKLRLNLQLAWQKNRKLSFFQRICHRCIHFGTVKTICLICKVNRMLTLYRKTRFSNGNNTQYQNVMCSINMFIAISCYVHSIGCLKSQFSCTNVICIWKKANISRIQLMHWTQMVLLGWWNDTYLK